MLMEWSMPADGLSPSGCCCGFAIGDLGGGVLLLDHGDREPRNVEALAESAMAALTALASGMNLSSVIVAQRMPDMIVI